MNREEVEQRSLEEVKRILSAPDAERMYLKRFDTIALEGQSRRSLVRAQHRPCPRARKIAPRDTAPMADWA